MSYITPAVCKLPFDLEYSMPNKRFNKGRKTLGLRSFVANFSQAFMRPILRRWYDSHSQVKRTDPCLTF